MRRFGLLLAMALLAACQTTPAPPLLSPLAETGSYGYGYAERQVGPEDWEVTYVGPVRRTSAYAGTREADQIAARTQAFDFMLWRAAQIAQREGYPAFRLGPTNSNVDTRLEEYGYDPLYGSPWGWGPGWGVRRPYYPYYPSYPYPRTTWAYLQARISGPVHLLRAAAPGDYVADDVITQARRNYPMAEAVATPQ